MTEGTAIRIFQEAVLYMILVGLPALAVSLLVGLIIAIIQTATALQEMTLSFVPKIIATLLTIGIFAGWMFKMLCEFMQHLLRIHGG